MKIERRPVKQSAYCRGCDTKMLKETEMVTFYSFRCTGAYTHLCIPCATVIGELAKAPA